MTKRMYLAIAHIFFKKTICLSWSLRLKPLDLGLFFFFFSKSSCLRRNGFIILIFQEQDSSARHTIIWYGPFNVTRSTGNTCIDAEEWSLEINEKVEPDPSQICGSR